jgi:hypothetical protein
LEEAEAAALPLEEVAMIMKKSLLKKAADAGLTRLVCRWWGKITRKKARWPERPTGW